MSQISDWCHANNLIFTGHFGGEEDLLCHISQGDMLQELMMFDMPGADSILSYDRIDTPEFNINDKKSSADPFRISRALF